MLLSTCANQVLQEFGGVMPEQLLAFEDAKREFLAVRALELQKVGISTTDITVVSRTVSPTTRDSLIPAGIGDMIPAFVELNPSTINGTNVKYKVEILPVELIPDYEGARAIGFYGTPGRYRLAWDTWNEGTLTFWYDPVEDITQATGGTDLTFPAAFWMYVIKKAAYNLVRIARLKLAYLDPAELKQNAGAINGALTMLEQSLMIQVSEWAAEFKKYINLDLNSTAHLRRTSDEIRANGYNNITGRNPLDLAG